MVSDCKKCGLAPQLGGLNLIFYWMSHDWLSNNIHHILQKTKFSSKKWSPGQFHMQKSVIWDILVQTSNSCMTLLKNLPPILSDTLT